MVRMLFAYFPCRVLTSSSVRVLEALAEIGQNPPREETEESSGNKYSQMFKLKSLHLMAVFILIYIGVEVTLGGETYEAVSFIFELIIQKRKSA